MKLILSALLLSICLFQGVSFANRDEGLKPAKYFFLPEGDAARGKEVFSTMKCTACHQTSDSSEGESRPVAARRGPTLGMTQAEYPAGWIANSIVSPSHTIALDSDGLEEGSSLSRMPDFTDVLTVRQLVDLVAYIKSQSDE